MKIYSLLMVLGLSASSLVAQELASTAAPQKPKFTPSRENSLLDGKTAVKINAFSLILGTWSKCHPLPQLSPQQIREHLRIRPQWILTEGSMGTQHAPRHSYPTLVSQ